MRLRQLVIAAENLDVADSLQAVLGLGTPFPDKDVAIFGIINAVFAIGDQFLEVIAPTSETAPARRFLERTGAGGYMVIFDTDDLQAARSRVDAAGIRRVYDVDLDDISATHLHPVDIGAAIVSVDQPTVAGDWRWGGPDWKSNAVSGGLKGLVIESTDPQRIANRWGYVLGVEPVESPAGFQLPLDANGVVEIRRGATDRMAQFSLQHPDGDGVIARAGAQGLSTDPRGFTLANVRFELAD